MDEYKIKQIEEGLTKIEFPEFDKVSSDAPVFYNPHMELNRDFLNAISVEDDSLIQYRYSKNKKKEKLTFVIYLVEAELEEFVTKMK